MLAFVVPIKSPKVSKSWKNVEQLFERTAQSICNQTNSNFRVIVVCDEKPNIEFDHPNLQYMTLEGLPIPTTTDEKLWDRMNKFIVGIRLAKEMGCSHIMMADADDCVSKFLADFISKNERSYGYFLKRGYFYNHNSNVIKVMRKGFHQYCGTSHIVRSDLYDVSDETLSKIPARITSRSQIPKDIHDLYFSHRDVTKAVESKGGTLEPLPFFGAVYILGNNENMSSEDVVNIEKRKRMSLKSRLLRIKASLFDRRKLTPEIREEFGLYNISTVNF